MPESSREKLAMFTHVNKEQVICLPDVNTIYKVPLLLYEHNLAEWFAERLNLKEVSQRLHAVEQHHNSLNINIDTNLFKKSNNSIMRKWVELADRYDHLTKSCEIALVGKYTTQSDTYTSNVKALEHAGLEINRKVIIKYIDSSDLEKVNEKDDPVKYHEAWQAVCRVE